MGFAEIKSWTKKRSPSRVATVLFLVAGFVSALYWYAYCDRLVALAFSCLVLALFLSVYLLYNKFFSKQKDKSGLFFICLLCSGLIYMGVYTPFTVPDEIYHFEATYCASNAIMGLGYQADPLTMRADDALLIEDLSATVSVGNYDMIADGLGNIFADDSSLVEVTTGSALDPTSNLPQQRLPAAAGITIARLLNLGPYYLLYLGRLFNLAYFIVLAYLAYRIIPVGRNILATVSLLPMTLHLAASYSYDVGILGLAFLLTSLVVRSLWKEEPITAREVGEIGVVACLLAPCKVVYVFIVALLVFVPRKRFASRHQEIVVKGSILILPFLVIVIVKLGSLLSLSGVSSVATSTVDYRGVESGYFYTLSDVINAPIKFIIMYIRTIVEQGSFYLNSMLGTSLGWLQGSISAPGYYGVALVVILLLSCVCAPDDESELPPSVRVTAVMAFIASAVAIMASMLLGWTFNTELIIMGVQGRYFLPMLPLLLLALRTSRLFLKSNARPMLIGAMSSVNALYLIRTFAIALTIFA